MINPEAIQERGAHQESSNNGNGSTPKPNVDPEIIEFITNHADAISDGLLTEDEARRKELGQQIVEEATAQLPNHDPEKQPVETFLRGIIRGAYVRELKAHYNNGDLGLKADSAIKRMVGSCDGTTKLAELIFTTTQKEEADELIKWPASDQNFTDSETETTSITLGNLEEVLEKIKKISTRDKDILLKKFLHGMSDEQIGKDYDLSPYGVAVITRRALEKAHEHVAFESAKRKTPQQKIVDWIEGIKEHEQMTDLDKKFAVGQIPNLYMDLRDRDGSKSSKYILTYPKIDEGAMKTILKTRILGFFDRVNILKSSDRVALELSADSEAEPDHISALASIDSFIKNGKFIRFSAKNKLNTEITPEEKSNPQTEVITRKNDQEMIEALEELLTPREIQALSMLTEPPEQIDDKMHSGKSTIRSHLHNIKNKTGLNTTQLCILSYEIGLLDFSVDAEKKINLSESAHLGKREEECLQLLAEGLDYNEIASVLQISTSTTRTHLHNAYVKLGVDNKKLACLSAYINGKIYMPKATLKFICELQED